jgi:hypothetical protein
MSQVQERRISPRLAAIKNRSRIEFGVPSGRRQVAARVVDVSREGALIIAAEPPPLHQRSLIRMEEPAKTDWIAAVVVRLGDANSVGVRFVDPSPDDFLLAALVGVDIGPTLLGGPRPPTVDDVGL